MPLIQSTGELRYHLLFSGFCFAAVLATAAASLGVQAALSLAFRFGPGWAEGEGGLSEKEFQSLVQILRRQRRLAQDADSALQRQQHPRPYLVYFFLVLDFMPREFECPLH